MIILPILTTSLIRFSLGRLGEFTFWTWERKAHNSLTYGALARNLLSRHGGDFFWFWHERLETGNKKKQHREKDGSAGRSPDATQYLTNILNLAPATRSGVNRGNMLFCRAVTSILSQRLLHKMNNSRSFDSSYSRSLNLKTQARNSILSVDTFRYFR